MPLSTPESYAKLFSVTVMLYVGDGTRNGRTSSSIADMSSSKPAVPSRLASWISSSALPDTDGSMGRPASTRSREPDQAASPVSAAKIPKTACLEGYQRGLRLPTASRGGLYRWGMREWPRVQKRLVYGEAGLDGGRRFAEQCGQFGSLGAEGTAGSHGVAEIFLDHRLEERLCLATQEPLQYVDVRPCQTHCLAGTPQPVCCCRDVFPSAPHIHCPPFPVACAICMPTGVRQIFFSVQSASAPLFSLRRRRCSPGG